jgi:antitoxin MazE
MEAVIRKWGNSPALRLPTAVLREAGDQLDQKVVLRGRIVIQSSDKVENDLEALVSGINAATVHDEAGFGQPVGRETL